MRSVDGKGLGFTLGRWAVVSLGLLVSLALALTAQAQGTGSLEGQVVNGSAGGPDIGQGVPVVLHVWQGEVEVDSLETTTDGEGRFRFEGLDTDPGLQYWPEVTYLEVGYSPAEPVRFGGEQETADVTLTVYETTEDESVVTLDSVHLIVESFGQVLRVSEIHLFGNSGDRTYIGSDRGEGQRTTVTIPLPHAAVGIAFEDEESNERYIQTEDALFDTEPVPPGQETALTFFSYHLMVTADEIPFERRFAYPVAALNMLVAQPGLALNSSQLQAMGPQMFQDRQYDYYVVQNLDPETPLSMEFVPLADTESDQGMPGAPAESSQAAAGATTRGNQGLLLWLGVALAGAAVIGAVVYSLASRQPVSASGSTPDLASNPRARRLLAELADLEEAFEVGQMDEATYESQRAERVKELKSL